MLEPMDVEVPVQQQQQPTPAASRSPAAAAAEAKARAVGKRKRGAKRVVDSESEPERGGGSGGGGSGSEWSAGDEAASDGDSEFEVDLTLVSEGGWVLHFSQQSQRWRLEDGCLQWQDGAHRCALRPLAARCPCSSLTVPPLGAGR